MCYNKQLFRYENDKEKIEKSHVTYFDQLSQKVVLDINEHIFISLNNRLKVMLRSCQKHWKNSIYQVMYWQFACLLSFYFTNYVVDYRLFGNKVNAGKCCNNG